MALHRCSHSDGWQGLTDLLANALPGDEIHLAPGIYHGSGTLRLTSGVKLLGTTGVVLSSSGEGPILTIQGDDCRLSALTFIGTTAGQVFVRLDQAKRVFISECEFNGGGVAEAAVVAQRSSALQIQYCNVKNFGESLSTPKKGIFGALSFHFSEVRIEHNRCHDNKKHGIVFNPSTGRAEQNECWNNEWSGIIVGGGTRGVLSDVTLVTNRCHHNKDNGIWFSSGSGRAAQNECWSNGSSGLAVGELVSSAMPPNVTLIANRCHHNNNHGILFVSGTCQAEQNECWRNELSGLVVAHAEVPSSMPPDVTLVANRCHHNEQAGILFAVSTGRAERNECWRNEDSGIAVDKG